MGNAPRVLVLGIGNLLWADEGFGIRAVEAFHRIYQDDPAICVMDGGTQGVYLIQHIREADILVVFDAVDYRLPGGTIKIVEGDEVPHFLGVKKMSLHQTGFQEVLAMAEMLGDYPKHLLLVGVQPVELDDFGGSLRDEVKECIAPSLGHAEQWLASLGVHLRKRDVPLDDEDTIASLEMALHAYEAGRPHEADAYRYGDDRVLAGGRFAPPRDLDAEIESVLGMAVPGQS